MDDEAIAGVRTKAAELQKNLRELHDQLADVAPTTSRFTETAQKILNTTNELLAVEAQIPVLVDEKHRAVSSKWVRIGYTAIGAVYLCLTVVSGVGMVSRAWLLATVPLLGFAAAAALVERTAPRLGHRQRRNSSILAAAATLLLGLLISGVLAPWFLIATIGMALAALVLWANGLDGRKAIDPEEDRG